MERQAEQAEATQNPSESKDNGEIKEESVIHIPETVHDGEKCKHNFVNDYVDPDNGKQHQQCTKCWAGRWK